VLVNPNLAPAMANANQAEAAARAIGKQVIVFKAASESEIDAAFESMAQARAGALLVAADPFFTSRRDQLAALASRHAVPADYEWREFAQVGDLMSYGTSLTEGVSIAAALHTSTWLIGTLEVWIALRIMHQPVGLYESLILQSLVYAIRAVWFAVPSGLGVQEGGFVLVGHLLGIGPETALALSLASRLPDVALGLPGLAAWHWLETRRAYADPRGS
jgi:uncharacterized membrane protein YbhN (UPF0104 family)